ncbi:MAG: prepilin-type N-terminal cleavage/methylation domain-containing protein [Ethanoligenens sp.]
MSRHGVWAKKLLRFSRAQSYANRNGFTLIELIVVMAITSIIMAALVGVFVFTGNMANQTSLAADAQTAAIQVEQQIELGTRYATAVGVYPDNTGIGSAFSHYFYLDAAHPASLSQKANSNTPTLFTPTGASRLCLSLAFSTVSNNTVSVTIKVSPKGNTANVLYMLQTNLFFQNVPTIAQASGSCLGYMI